MAAYVCANEVLASDTQKMVNTAGESGSSIYAERLGSVEVVAGEMGKTADPIKKAFASWCHWCGKEYRAAYKASMYCSRSCRSSNAASVKRTERQERQREARE